MCDCMGSRDTTYASTVPLGLLADLAFIAVRLGDDGRDEGILVDLVYLVGYRRDDRRSGDERGGGDGGEDEGGELHVDDGGCMLNWWFGSDFLLGFWVRR